MTALKLSLLTDAVRIQMKRQNLTIDEAMSRYTSLTEAERDAIIKAIGEQNRD